MRSKEVDKSIKSLENFVNQKYYNGVTAEEMKTVLSYIEELEQLPNKIRDKIKEWDKSIKWNNSDDHYYAIKILRDLIGE